MISSVHDRSLRFRKKFFLAILMLLLAVAYPFKFLNLLLAYVGAGEQASIEDTPGFLLVRLISSVNWESAVSLGYGASFSVLATLLLLKLTSLRRISPILYRTKLRTTLSQEASVYFLLFASFSALGILGVIAAGTLANLTFGPLLMFSLINPKWEQQYIRARSFIALCVIVLSFISFGSKTIIFYVAVAFLYRSFFLGRGRILAIGFGLVLLLIYPYLNFLRSSFEVRSVQDSVLVLNTLIKEDFDQIGIFSMLSNSYIVLLDRLVGLEGLIVASTFVSTDITSGSDVSYALMGWRGVGIAMGGLGSLALALGDLFLTFILFPFVVAIVWRFSELIDFYLNDVGFSSFGTFLYLKATMLLIGGFLWTDIKLVLFTITILFIISIFRNIISVRVTPPMNSPREGVNFRPHTNCDVGK